jgi:hypothetical protein
MAGIEMSIPDMGDAISKVNSAVEKIDQAALFAVGQVGLAVERKAKQLLQNNQHGKSVSKAGKVSWIPPYHMGGNGSPPNRRTGNLSRSIYTDLQNQPGSYVANVYPTMVYARALELGNPNWKSGVKYPYMQPAFDLVRPQATSIFEKAFARKMVI